MNFETVHFKNVKKCVYLFVNEVALLPECTSAFSNDVFIILES